MKDSGIEWIGEIPKDWKIDKMNRICSVITDYVASGSFADLAENVKYLDEPDYAMLVRTMDVSNKGYSSKPVYINEHAYNYLKNSNLFGGELLLPNIGGVGEIYIVPKLYDKMSLAPNSIIIKTNYYDKYYYYFFYCEAGALSIKQISQSTAQLKFNKTQFKQIKGCVPPLLEQQKIADFLDEKCSHIDSVLEKVRASIDEYKQLKQSVITQAVTKGIRPNRPMKDSGIEWIGEIPQDWSIIAHKYVMYKDKKICEHYNGEDIISLTMSGVIKRDLDAGGKMPTTFDGYQYVEPEDLLLCLFDIDVTPRCVGVVKDYGITSPAYSRFKVNKGYFNKYYDYLLRMIDNDKVFVHLAKNLRSSLKEDDFGAIKTIVPPMLEQKQISDYLDDKCSEIDKLITKKEQLIAELETYKKSLIYEYVTGKKEVK